MNSGLSDLSDKIGELLKGVAAPVYFCTYALGWEDIRGLANGVSGELNPAVLPAGKRWKGAAADGPPGYLPAHAATSAANNRSSAGSCSGCHCTPSTKVRPGSSTASTVPSGAHPTTSRSSATRPSA